MKKIQKLKHKLAFASALLVAALSFVALTPAVPSVQAENCAGVEISIKVGCDNTQGNPIFAYAIAIINFISILVIVLVIGAIIFAGIMYMTANGDSGQTTKAIDMIRNSVIGLVLYLLFSGIINFLIPGGLFTGATATPGANSGPPTCNALNLELCTTADMCATQGPIFAWDGTSCKTQDCSATSLLSCNPTTCVSLGADYFWQGGTEQSCGKRDKSCTANYYTLCNKPQCDNLGANYIWQGGTQQSCVILNKSCTTTFYTLCNKPQCEGLGANYSWQIGTGQYCEKK